MSKLKWYIILALALWLAFCGMAAAEQLYVNESGWWRDGGTYNASTAPIQAAVGAATAGDSIYVHGGSYTGHVDVDKELTLEGEGAEVVTVTATSSSDSVFEVTAADYVNISGFAVRGATDYDVAGINLDNANYCDISRNNVYGNYRGIRLSSSSNNTLESNTANSNNYHGIVLYHSSDYNTLTNNTANSNTWYGINLRYSGSNNIISNNTANSNDRGICLLNADNNMIENNNCSNNRDGIYLDFSIGNTLKSNTANSNKHGITK